MKKPTGLLLIALWLVTHFTTAAGEEPSGDLARRLAEVKFVRYAEAPGYSEGPAWLKGDVFFCSGALLRATAPGKVHPYLEIGPAGIAVLANDHLLICDNKHRALLDLAPDGKLGVVAEHFEMRPLQSLNDVTVDSAGNVYWTDPEGSSAEKPEGRIYRLQTDGRVDRIASNLAFPNGIEVDPASKNLFVIESQSKKILRYELPGDNRLLGKPELFYDLGGSGGDGCSFDAEGNLWVADFHRPDSQRGRITVLSPKAEVLAHLELPTKVVSNITFGGAAHDEIFCTTGDPPGVCHAKVGVKGFRGHPGRPLPVSRYLNTVPLRQHQDGPTLRSMAELVSQVELSEGHLSEQTSAELKRLAASLTAPEIRANTQKLLPQFERSAVRFQQDRALITEIHRLQGKVTQEVFAPTWLRSIASDQGLPLFNRIVEIELNERTDGHKEPEPKDLADRVTDDWLKRLADQDQLRRLELSGTAVTSAGLSQLKDLTNLERLNLCLTACDDRGLEHLQRLSRMRRMTICASKITGAGFTHLGGMKALESINLHSAPASDAGLAAISRFTTLKRLEIVHTEVTDAGLQHLAKLVNLQQLHVHGPKTTANALPFLSQLHQLYELDVYDEAASNATLAQIANLPKLRKLMLISGTFDDSAVKHLVKAITLEELTLDSPNVTDASIETLAQLQNLRQLSLTRSKITAVGQKQLQMLLPQTTISF